MSILLSDPTIAVTDDTTGGRDTATSSRTAYPSGKY
ncbi:hypothetical protein IWX78_002599 [Mycetocola sp. CAN_C7]